MIKTHYNVDIAVIGAGPAGLAAAITAKKEGVDNVVVIERAEKPGGLLFQCIHNGFGLHRFKEDLTGPEYAHRFIEEARDLNVNIMLSTIVLDITPNKTILTTNSTSGLVRYKAKALVLAMGCRERTRQALMIHGTRPAGVLTAGTAQRYINVEGVMPGNKFVILGSGDIGMIMARRLILEGAQVEAIVEILPYVGGLLRNEVQCISDFDIPLLLEHTVTDIHGLDRVEAVTIARVDKCLQPIFDTKRTIGCDTLLLSVGLIPENELAIKAGVILDPITGGPIVNNNLETNVSGIFAAGNVLHVHDLVDSVSEEAEVAGMAASAYVLENSMPSKRKISLKVGENIKYVVPQSIFVNKDSTLFIRVKKPADNIRLCLGDIHRKKLRAVRPSEMLKIHLSQKTLNDLSSDCDELRINCVNER